MTLDPGLARVKLVVSNEAGTPILKHQFLVIWLTIGTPAIDEVGASDPTGTRVWAIPPVTACSTPGRRRASPGQVKGTFPHPLGPGGKFTLPDDWATIAEALADDADSNPANDTGFWDIHDDRTKKEDHRPGLLPGQGPRAAARGGCSGQLPRKSREATVRRARSRVTSVTGSWRSARSIRTARS